MERRRYHRFNLNLKVEYRILESLKPYKISATEDASEEGIRIGLSEYIEPNTRLELIVKIPCEPKPIVMLGRVAWAKKGLGERFFTTGIHIAHIKDEDRKKLYQYAFL